MPGTFTQKLWGTLTHYLVSMCLRITLGVFAEMHIPFLPSPLHEIQIQQIWDGIQGFELLTSAPGFVHPESTLVALWEISFCKPHAMRKQLREVKDLPKVIQLDGGRGRSFFFFFTTLTFYFILEYSRLTMLWYSQGNSRATQPLFDI